MHSSRFATRLIPTRPSVQSIRISLRGREEGKEMEEGGRRWRKGMLEWDGGRGCRREMEEGDGGGRWRNEVKEGDEGRG